MNKNETLEEILESYIKEYNIDVFIDEMRLREIELKIPSLKNKWSGRKAIHRAKLVELKKRLADYETNGVDMIKSEMEKKGEMISRAGAENILKKTEAYKILISDIEKLNVLYSFFESCEKNMQSMTFDVKNLVETIKIEES
jgi:hypothetical protein